MSVAAAQEAASRIDGYVSVAEGRLLYSLASTAAGSIVEVGSWKGRSTIWLAYGSRDGLGGRVFAVDPHSGSSDHDDRGEGSTLEEFERNLREAGVDDTVTPVVMSSLEAREHIPCPVGLLFLDGPSEEVMVREELERWLPCLGKGGVIAIHDTVSIPGPREAAEHLYLSSRFVNVRLVGTITYATVVGEAPVRGKLRDLSRLMARRTEIIIGRVNYPAPVRRLGRKVLASISK